MHVCWAVVRQVFKKCLWPQIHEQCLQLNCMWQSPAVILATGKYRVLFCRLKQCWSNVLLKICWTYHKRNNLTAFRFACRACSLCVCVCVLGKGCHNFQIIVKHGGATIKEHFCLKCPSLIVTQVKNTLEEYGQVSHLISLKLSCSALTLVKTEGIKTHKKAATEGGHSEGHLKGRWCPWVPDFRQSWH